MTGNLQPRTVFPDFTLPDDTGVMRRLSDIQGDSAMVVMLGRGEHCPGARQHQFEMVKFQ